VLEVAGHGLHSFIYLQIEMLATYLLTEVKFRTHCIPNDQNLGDLLWIVIGVSEQILSFVLDAFVLCVLGKRTWLDEEFAEMRKCSDGEDTVVANEEWKP